MSASFDALVEKTYEGLLSVVQTTAVSRRVLQRPPFTFLHMLLVETLAPYGIFTPPQLEFARLASKEDKAAFLTRALAFVTFTMAECDNRSMSMLLLVSPVKMLAGVAVEDTHSYLQQLCVVCKSPNADAKESAAREVLARGDAQLYTTGVAFRRGLVLIQAITRAFISRRIAKRKAIAGSALGAPSNAAPFQSQLFATASTYSMTVGTKFLKELPRSRVYDGVIVAVRGKRYTLRYEQDSGVEDEVDEIEMKILLEESFRLHKLRERIRSPRDALRQDDAEISLTSLPDLTPSLMDDGSGRPKVAKRLSSSREFERLVSQAASSARPLLLRSMSTRQSGGSTPPISTRDGEANSRKPSSANRAKLHRITSQQSEDGDKTLIERDSPASLTSDEAQRNYAAVATEEKPWQVSLKQLLSKGQTDVNAEIAERLGSQKKKTHERAADPTPTSNDTTTSVSFPELSIPGKRKLLAVQKRKQPTAGFKSPGVVAKPQPKPKVAELLESNRSKPSDASSHNGHDAGRSIGGVAVARSLPSMTSTSEGIVDKAFGGAYQSTDHKTQEKLALFREIVNRIDGYMKRKRLRVIDLFRFCDADGNGSISPEEMIDTLSQMEIQLSPEQANEFIEHIDKDGNGSIDVDEFEELLRVARRSEAQREQLKRELQHGKKATSGDLSAKSGSSRYAALIKGRHRILDELKALDLGDVGAVSASQAKSTILRLQLAGVDEVVVSELLERSRTHLSSLDASAASTPPMEQAVDTTVYLQHIAKALNDLEWSKKANRFLDQSWLAQFDSQLERAFRDFELL